LSAITHCILIVKSCVDSYVLAGEGWVGRSENKFLFSAYLNGLQRDEKNADNILSNPLGGNTVDLSL